jgi:hypothetical protein
MAYIEHAPHITYGTHTSEKVADLSVAHFLQYAPLIRSPRYLFIFLFLDQNLYFYFYGRPDIFIFIFRSKFILD